ncbi:MAG TPA: DEAD/DEAH box helicase [Thermoanaerobaculia bacterium]
MPRGSVERGDEYFARGRVRRLERKGGAMVAEVMGTQPYEVRLLLEPDDILSADCTCPWFDSHLAPCKHIWATIRAADTEKLLPESALSIDSVTVPARQAGVRRVSKRPAWEAFLDALRRGSEGPGRASRSVPDEIAYVLLPSTSSLTLQLLGRAKKKNNEWGKWKPLQLTTDDLPLLEPFDREAVALLHQRAYSEVLEPMVNLSTISAGWWVERLARANRLYLGNASSGELRPVLWDDGAPWSLRVGIGSDPARGSYRIEATVERENETLPLAMVQATIGGILISDDRASRFDDGGKAAWLYALRASGPIEVPHQDAERFRRALLHAPVGDLVLPPELGWDVVEAAPQPQLLLRHDSMGTELQGELVFLYADWRVSSRSAEGQHVDGRRLIRRDRNAEEGFRKKLGSLPITGTSDGYRIRLAHLEEVAGALANDGWTIEIDGTALRVAEELELDVTSGIDWFDLTASASFGDTRIGLPELLAAAETRRSLLRLTDGTFGIVPQAWSERLAPVLELGKRDGDRIRFRHLQAVLIESMLQAKQPIGDAAFAAIRERLTTTTPEPRQEPMDFGAELRPYQRAGLGWMSFLREANIGGCLADDMGLGKTVQTLALLETLSLEGVDRPSLVVAPRSLLFNWAAEAKRFAPHLRVLEHHGGERFKSAEALSEYDIVLTTYATMRLDVAHLTEIEFEYVILDEAQAIKNASSQVAKAARLLRSRHRLALSGTPIENHLGELWSLFEFLNPGLLGTARSFSRTFGAKTSPPERRDALARALRPLILRRTKEQVAPELPERIEQTIYCELEGKQRQQYDELRDHYRTALLGNVRNGGGLEKSRMQILEALLRLRQAACHPLLVNRDTDAPSAKTELLLEELRDVVDSGHRALVFSQFTSFLGIVRDAVQAEGIDHLYLDGSTRDRQSLVEQFQREDGPPLFLISLKAGGLGLNLTNADYIFLLDPWWNPAVEAQAIDRAHRIGRTRPVVAYRLIARDTVEEKILELQSRKRELAESIISEDNSVLRRLEVEDLEMLLA